MARGLGKPAAASWGASRLDVFVRMEDRSLLHTWEDGADGATVNLGGELASDPVAVAHGPGRLEVFARGFGQKLLHWTWDAGTSRMVGPEDWGWVAEDPVALSWRPDHVDVYASSVDGPLRQWAWPVGSGRPVPFLATGSRNIGLGALVSDRPNNLDLFMPGSGFQLEQWKWDGTTFVLHRSLGGKLISNPVVVSWAPSRFDVYARVEGGRMKHWGFDGFLTGKWFGPEDSIAEILDTDPVVASRGEHEVDMVARMANGTLLHWAWDAGPRAWVGPQVLGSSIGVASEPMTLARDNGSLDVLARAEDGGLLHWRLTGAAVIQSHRPLVEPPAPIVPWPADQARPPDHLLVRPRDHVVLGVHWSDCQLVDGVPPVLEATSSAGRVVLTFPPQHVAEEVLEDDEPLTSTVLRAQLARASRVAFSVPPDARIPLTAEGLLEALDGATVLPGSGAPADDLTGIELPWGLIVGPESADPAGAVRARHPARPLEGTSGATGLWRTRLEAEKGLAVRALHSGSADPFPLPLTRDGRLTIVAQTTPAAAARMELSALGGSLSATGRWENFEWDHDASLGRDRKVRTVARGVLYPLGHRAEYVELSERVVDPGSGEPIAVLRKRRVLVVTEPLRSEASRAFPFSEVEITKLVYRGLADPDWRMHPRPTLEVSMLEAQRDQRGLEMTAAHDEVHGDMGWGGVGPVMEDLADERAEAAAFLGLRAEIEGLTEAIAALKALGTAVDEVPTFFTPTAGDTAKPVRFPVRLGSANGDLQVSLPLIFVQDVRLRGDLREAFFSLSDTSISVRLRDEYTASGAGMVDVPGVPLDLVRSGRAERPPSDVQEVHRLNLAGTRPGIGYSPRLGLTDLPPLPDGLPDPRGWAVEVAMPAMRSLLGTDPIQARVPLMFAKTFEDVGDAADVALQVFGKPLDIDFRDVADRAGGLVSPRIAADAISRVHGLVNLAGSQTLDPAQLLGEGASLLGFDFRELIGTVTEPPAIVTDLIDGQPPVVTMTWTDVPLKPFPEGDSPVFKPGAGGSTMNMTVKSSPSSNETTCVVRDFSLVMPPGASALLELTFGSLTFTQTGGKAPTLDVDGVDAQFVGDLALLQALQESVGLGSAGPSIDVSARAIAARYSLPVPDVSVLAFTMRNLVFHAAVTVPFTRDPVSVALGFGSREKPFTLGVLMFGGGGYVDVEIVHSGLRRLEISLEFGAAVAIGVGIATAEVHAMGGIRYELRPNGSVVLTGYIRIGGSVDIIGVVLVSVELLVTLDYRSEGNKLVGRARLIIEIDLTLFSDSIELDSGEWEIAGGDAPVESLAPVVDDDAAFQEWVAYRQAFRV